MTAELTYLQTFGVVNTLVSTMRFAVFDPAAAFRPYVGTWQLSTYKLTVTPDLTGEQVMYSSRPCQDGAETMCTVRYRLKFAVNRDGTVQGTYTRLRYVNKAGKEYSPFDTGLSIYEGLTFNLRAAGPNRLAVALDDPDDLLGFGFYCGAGATAAERQSCGVTGGQLYG